MISDGDLTEDWSKISIDIMDSHRDSKSIMGIRGPIEPDYKFNEEYFLIPKETKFVKSNLKGDFILDSNGEVYYNGFEVKGIKGNNSELDPEVPQTTYTPEKAFNTTPTSGGVLISGYLGYSAEEQANISIPPTINGEKVVGIGPLAFAFDGVGGNKSSVKLKTVIVPDEVVSIDINAFGTVVTRNNLTLVQFGKNSKIENVAAGSIRMLEGGVIIGPSEKKSVIFDGKNHSYANWVDL